MPTEPTRLRLGDIRLGLCPSIGSLVMLLRRHMLGESGVKLNWLCNSLMGFRGPRLTSKLPRELVKSRS